jgi:hypothetical protein
MGTRLSPFLGEVAVLVSRHPPDSMHGTIPRSETEVDFLGCFNRSELLDLFTFYPPVAISAMCHYLRRGIFSHQLMLVLL